VAGDSLHGRQVNVGLDEMSNRGVPEGVTHDLLGIEPGSPDDAAEGITDIDGVALDHRQA